MKHLLSKRETTLSVEPIGTQVVQIKIFTNANNTSWHMVELNKEDLSDFIGSLLHVQAKMRK